jgi:hypothetical protein
LLGQVALQQVKNPMGRPTSPRTPTMPDHTVRPFLRLAISQKKNLRLPKEWGEAMSEATIKCDVGPNPNFIQVLRHTVGIFYKDIYMCRCTAPLYSIALCLHLLSGLSMARMLETHPPEAFPPVLLLPCGTLSSPPFLASLRPACQRLTL